MNNPFDYFISLSELVSDFAKVDSILAKWKEAFIISEDKPTYVVLSVERYNEFAEAVKALEAIAEKKALPRLINAVGKRCFIHYYNELRKNYENKTSNIDFLPDEFTLSSKRVRVSNAKKIFEKGWEIDALRLIIDSNRVDDEIVARAKEHYLHYKSK